MAKNPSKPNTTNPGVKQLSTIFEERRLIRHRTVASLENSAMTPDAPSNKTEPSVRPLIRVERKGQSRIKKHSDYRLHRSQEDTGHRKSGCDSQIYQILGSKY